MAKLEVLITDLRLREKPSLSGKVLGFATKGVHEYTGTTKADGYTWYNIKEGYIAAVSGAIKEVSEKVSPVPKDLTKDQVYVSNFVLNIRNKPSTSGSKVGTCEKNSYYNVLSISNESDYTWYKLAEGNWVAGVDELIFYKAGGSEEGDALSQEIKKTLANLDIVNNCITDHSCTQYYKELKIKLEEINKYINTNFDPFKYDYVDEKEYKEIDILYTADTHGAWVGYDMNGNYLKPVFSYSDVGAYRTKLEKNGIKTLIVDAGDWSRPCKAYNEYKSTGVMRPAQEMKTQGYFLATYGNHEWRWSQYKEADTEYDILDKLVGTMSSCNMLRNGSLVYRPYKTAKIGSKKVAVIGIGYPSANGEGTYSNGVWTYGKYQFLDDTRLYQQVQKYIDLFKENNFDYIIAVCHMCKSTYESDNRYKARTDSLIKNTKGLTAVIQGHYNFATNAETITDKGGKSVLLAHESGANMNSFGRLQLRPGKVTSYLLDDRNDLNVI